MHLGWKLGAVSANTIRFKGDLTRAICGCVQRFNPLSFGRRVETDHGRTTEPFDTDPVHSGQGRVGKHDNVGWIDDTDPICDIVQDVGPTVRLLGISRSALQHDFA